MPKIPLTPGKQAFAECAVKAEAMQVHVAKIRIYLPGENRCIEFGTETFGLWYSYGEHYHFRKRETMQGTDARVEILISNILPEHNLTMIQCTTEDISGSMLTCTNSSSSILIVEGNLYKVILTKHFNWNVAIAVVPITFNLIACLLIIPLQ